ncbi:Ribosome maturation protein Sdo1 [Methanonatronarchaeum thermophilum]|uniref:Ribosome maturation protein Sdo1 n=1 Tax=Methanonatronarchaeum thermophilum TaxID=1927129 RepID=A0A1Y3GH51_9EURY|nr:ribosome assembly factor SBDS [Methanonatronarchaeum thermophilum]OUJ19524.1 Ribosome maturation protein Sdo1 [Methanonatronarchaeum thermophilum]
MVSLDDAVTARMESHGTRFEVLVDPDLALALKNGSEVDFDDLLAIDKIFKDASRGDEASDEMMTEVYNTTDPNEIAEKIIKEGDIQLTSEQRKRIQQQKKRKVINKIARNAVNPQQNDAPHPPNRIEKAMEEAGVRIDPFEPVNKQVDIALDAIRPIIPIKFKQKKFAVLIPGKYSGSAYGQMQNFGQIVDEEWQDDGSWVGVIQCPGGIRGELEGLVAEITEGNGEVKAYGD